MVSWVHAGQVFVLPHPSAGASNSNLLESKLFSGLERLLLDVEGVALGP